MGGAAITIALQQLKGFLGIKKFTKNTDIVSVMRSVWGSVEHGVKLRLLFQALLLLLVSEFILSDGVRLLSAVELADDADRISLLGFPSGCQIHRVCMLLSQLNQSRQPNKPSDQLRLQGKKKQQQLFWVPAIAPLISVILATLLVYITRADKHGVQIVSPSAQRSLHSIS